MTDINFSLPLPVPKLIVLLCECKYYENFLGRFHVVIVVAVSSCFANAEYKISCGVKSEFCTLRRTSDLFMAKYLVKYMPWKIDAIPWPMMSILESYM